MGLPLWMGTVPEYQVINDYMQITVGEMVLAMPINVFLVGCAKGKAAIVNWERDRKGEVVRFPGVERRAEH